MYLHVFYFEVAKPWARQFPPFLRGWGGCLFKEWVFLFRIEDFYFKEANYFMVFHLKANAGWYGISTGHFQILHPPPPHTIWNKSHCITNTSQNQSQAYFGSILEVEQFKWLQQYHRYRFYFKWRGFQVVIKYAPTPLVYWSLIRTMEYFSVELVNAAVKLLNVTPSWMSHSQSF